MFTVRIPFVVPRSNRIADDEATTSLGGVSFTLKGDGYLHVLKAEGFATEPDAEDFLERAQSALAWLLLSSSVPATAQLAPQKIRYNDDPAAEGERYAKATDGIISGPIDAFIHGPEAAIYPSGKRLVAETALPVSGYNSCSSAHALAKLVEGVSFPASQTLAQHKKLVVALDLYGAHFSENSDTARFLTLIMVLEALAGGAQKAPLVVRLLDKWADEAEGLSEDPTTPIEDVSALRVLKQDLLQRKRKEKSIGAQIRSLVRSSLADSADVAERESETQELYDLRSRLVHSGKLEPAVVAKAASQARQLVERVVRYQFLKAVRAHAGW